MNSQQSGQLIYAPPSIWVWENPDNEAFTNDVYDLLDPVIKVRLGRYIENEDLSVSTLEDIEPFNNDELLEFADVAIIPISVPEYYKESIENIIVQIERVKKFNLRIIIILETSAEITGLHPGIADHLSRSNYSVFFHEDFNRTKNALREYFSSIPEYESSNQAIAERRINNVIQGNTTELQLGNLGLSTLPQEFGLAAQHCTKIQLGHKYYDFNKRKHRFIPSQFNRNNIITSFEFNYLKNLKELYLSNNHVETKTLLGILKNDSIRLLDISYTGVVVNLSHIENHYDYLNVSGLSFQGNVMHLNSVKVLTAQRIDSEHFAKYLETIHSEQLIDIDLSYSHYSLYACLKHFTALKRLVIKSSATALLEDERLMMDITKMSKTLADLTVHRLKIVPDLLVLEAIERLNLQECSIHDLAAIIDRYPKLEILNVSKNSIEAIELIKEHEKLHTLIINENPLHSFRGIHALKNIKTLYANHCWNLNSFNTENLPELEQLSLTDVKIKDWSFLNHLSQLQFLDISNNPGVDQKPIQLKAIKVFRANNCSITNAMNLEISGEASVIELANNSIPSVLPFIDSIRKRLRVVLDIPFKERETQSSRKREVVTKSNGLHLQFNPISEPAPEVILDGRKSILRYFGTQESNIIVSKKIETEADKKRGKKNIIQPTRDTSAISEIEKQTVNYFDKFEYKEVKIIVVGNPNVGKTYLSHYMKSGRKNLPENNASTNGMESHHFELDLPNGITIQARLLDFGGQDYFHDTHHLFFTTDTIYLALWNITSNSFDQKLEMRYNPKSGKEEPENNDMYPLEYWLDAIGRFTSSITDMTEGNEEERLKSDRSFHPPGNVIVVQTRRGTGGYDFRVLPAIKANEHLVHSMASIDLYRNSENDKIKELGVTELYLNLQDIAERLVTGTWFKYYQVILEIFKALDNPDLAAITKQYTEFKDKIIFSSQEFKEFLNSHFKKKGIDVTLDDSVTQDVIRFLSNRGYIFKSEEQICVLPYHFTARLYEAMSKVKNANGIVKKETFHNALPEEALVKVAINSKIIIQGAIDNHYIIPQHLPPSFPEQISMFMEAFGTPVLAYDIKGYIHKSIVQNLFSKFTEWIDGDPLKMPVWRSGMILKIKGNEPNNDKKFIFSLSIIQNKDKRRIQVCQLGDETKYDILKKIASQIEEIIRSIKGGQSFDKYVSDGKSALVEEKILINASNNISSFILSEKETKVRVADLRHWLPATSEKPMKKIFISYSSSDVAFMKKLEVHLKPFVFNGKIDLWHDRKIQPGTLWDDTIQKNLKESDLVLFLVSPEFLATSYIRDFELQKVIDSQKSFAFLLLKDCNWESVIKFSTSQGFIDESKEQIMTSQIGNAANPMKKPMLIIGDPENNEQWMKFIRDFEKRLL